MTNLSETDVYRRIKRLEHRVLGGGRHTPTTFTGGASIDYQAAPPSDPDDGAMWARTVEHQPGEIVPLLRRGEFRNSGTNQIAVSPDGEHVAIAGATDDPISILSLPECSTVTEIDEVTVNVYALSFEPSGALWASGSNGELHHISAAFQHYAEYNVGSGTSRPVATNGERIVYGPGSTLHFADTANPEASETVTMNGTVGGAEFSPDGEHVAVGAWGSGVTVFTAEGEQVSQFGGSVSIYQPRWIDNETVLYGEGNGVTDPPVYVVEYDTGDVIEQYPTTDDPINVEGVAASRDGRRIAHGDRNGLLRVWDRPSGNLIYEQQFADVGTNSAEVTALSFTPRGDRLIVGEGLSGRCEIHTLDRAEEVVSLSIARGGSWTPI